MQRSAARPADSSNKQLLVLAAGHAFCGQWEGVRWPPAGLVWSKGVCKSEGPASKVACLFISSNECEGTSEAEAGS